MLKLEELACPSCGAENNDRKRHIELERGVAACNACGHRGPVSEFQRKERP